jgi:hypothetical protein
MEWDYRFVIMSSANGGEDWIELREVHYHDDGSLMGHANPCFGSDSMDGLKEITLFLEHASKMPPLHENDFPPDFLPPEFEPKEDP